MTKPLPRAIRISPEYGADCLWTDGTDPNWDVALQISDLPLPASLREDLMAWDDRYDQTYDRSNPAASGFESDDEEIAFVEDGKSLATRLKAELPDIEWTYNDVRKNEVVEVR